jgi:pimeloyl-ACP methyl ester carboxylesterase
MRWKRPLIVTLVVLAMLSAGCQDGAGPKPRTGMATSADGATIAYGVAGRGPTVVLVHCWSGDRTFFDDLMSYLMVEYRVIAVDLAGHGKSSAERVDYTMEAFADDVFAVLDQEEIDTCLVVGHSMGGTVALTMAGRQPDRVRGLIAVDTLHRVERAIPLSRLQFMMAPLREDFRSGMAEYAGRMFPEGTSPEVEARAIDVMAAASPAVAFSAIEHLFTHDLATAAAAWQGPIYFLTDVGHPVDVVAWREQGVDPVVVKLEGVGHFPMFTAPERFKNEVRLALEALTPAPKN